MPVVQVNNRSEHPRRAIQNKTFRTHDLEVRQHIGLVHALEFQQSQHVQVPRQPSKVSLPFPLRPVPNFRLQ